MAMMLPPELNTTLELAGLWFPNVNEDEIRLDADAARIVQAGTAQASAGATTGVQAALAGYTGDSATRLASYWQETGTDSGHLAQATTAMRVAPVALDGLATVVTGTKVAVGTIAAIGTVRLAMALLSGGPFAGLSATASLLATRRAGVKVFREAAEGSGRVLAPAVTKRVTQPMRDILDRLRPPGGGRTALAGAGPGRMPASGLRDSFDRSPWIMQRGGKGGRGGGRGRNESEANLSAEEQAAVDAKNAGQPYDRSVFNRAAQKEKKAEKFAGDRNAQKRGRKK
ncbi:hypothetical protein ACIBQX_31250 [Nonomuraea sp. NPDC049714]|uniref:hypothetical protein n=1 Tax=Nonomuraea sp. NPDC049714 TaxID=3364357 RepID=UPI0037A00508